MKTRDHMTPANMDELQAILSLLDPPLLSAEAANKIGEVLETGGKVLQLGELLSKTISSMEQKAPVQFADMAFIRHFIGHVLTAISDDIEELRSSIATENRGDYLNYRIAVLSEQIDKRYVFLKDFTAALHKFQARTEERLELRPQTDEQEKDIGQ